jgi:hypothetical protein
LVGAVIGSNAITASSGGRVHLGERVAGAERELDPPASPGSANGAPSAGAV